MTPDGSNDGEIQRLLRAIEKKVLAKADVILDAKGDVRIRISRKGSGYQIDVNVSI